MPIDILGIKDFYIDRTNEPKLTLTEYTSILRALLCKSIGGSRAFLVYQNQDLFANLLTILMTADWTFDGRGTIEGWRKYCVLNALKKSYSRSKRLKPAYYEEVDNVKQCLMKSLPSGYIKIKGDRERIVKNSSDEWKDTLDIEFAEGNLLKSHEKECLRLYYYEGETMEEISKKVGKTIGGVSFIINNSLRKLKRKYSKQD